MRQRVQSAVAMAVLGAWLMFIPAVNLSPHSPEAAADLSLMLGTAEFRRPTWLIPACAAVPLVLTLAGALIGRRLPAFFARAAVFSTCSGAILACCGFATSAKGLEWVTAAGLTCLSLPIGLLCAAIVQALEFERILYGPVSDEDLGE